MKLKALLIGLLIAVFILGMQMAFGQSVTKIKEIMAMVNEQPQVKAKHLRLEEVEFYTYSHNVGQIVYFDDRSHQMGSHWVPGDPNRDGRTTITWLSDQIEGMANGLNLSNTQTAVGAAMNTWNTVNCAIIPLEQLPDYGFDWGYVQNLLGFGGVPGWYADITHAGWLDEAFFDSLFGEDGDYVLGVTFTFIWVDSVSGEPTDIDNNGKSDVAFREIYYNNHFLWGIGTGNPVDVETIVLHEAGHGVSLGHFGKLIRTSANGKLHFAPLAVMNAGYTQVQHNLTGTDMASFCSIWARWPYR